MTRGALAAAGFARRTAGEWVCWESRGAAPDAPVIVLVHGVNDQAGTWFLVAPVLAGTHRVLLPDLAGHGESAPPAGPLPLSSLVAQLEALLAPERDVILVGNSLGGWIAALHALAHPERVRRLVLEAGGGLARPFASPVVAHDRDEALVVLRAVHGPAFEPPEWVIESLLQRAIDSPMLRITEAEEHRLDTRLAALRVPVTLVWGADDGVLPLSYAEELRSLIPRAELCVIDDAAHIPHLQNPEKFLACLTAIF